ncbi:hypothetical protein AMJ51_01820 [Microgenomates bacterium DG_75]|nr:MAG: hypothetical protein AMJ51_01820 [Microgenomates bacterium DG_75]
MPAAKITVVKYDGREEAYNQKKVLDSILRAGVNKEEAQKILSQVEAKLHDKITTKKLYQIVHQEIVRQNLPIQSNFYRLREALAKMDSIDFEKFIKEILEKEGYASQWNVIVPGFCVEHQIDVIAKNKSNETFFVEVKHHRNFHRDCGLGEMAELWGRLEDLQKGYQKGKSQYDFSNAWLITNTKFSEHAKKYASCKQLRLTGWRYEFEDITKQLKDGLEKKIEKLGVEVVNQMIRDVVKT